MSEEKSLPVQDVIEKKSTPSGSLQDFFKQKSNLLLISSLLILLGFFLPWASVGRFSESPPVTGIFLISKVSGLPGFSWVLILFLISIPACAGIVAYYSYQKNFALIKTIIFCISLATFFPVPGFFILFVASIDELGGSRSMGIGMIMMITGSVYCLFFAISQVLKNNPLIHSRYLVKDAAIGAVVTAIAVFTIIRFTNATEGWMAFFSLVTFASGIIITNHIHSQQNGVTNYGRMIILGFVMSVFFNLIFYILATIFYIPEMKGLQGSLSFISILLLCQLSLIITSLTGMLTSKINTTPLATQPKAISEQFIQEPGVTKTPEVVSVLSSKRNRGGQGNVIAMIVKIFAYVIIGIVGLGFVFLAIFSIGYFPLKDFIFHDGIQNLAVWGTLFFFIALPIIGIITWIIRKIARVKSNGRMLVFTFGALWVIGLICFIFLFSSFDQDFKYRSKNLTEHEIALTNPTIDRLEITSKSPLNKYNRVRSLRFRPFEGIKEDTAFVDNIDVRIVKASNNSFKVTVIKIASGGYRNKAEENAAKIQYSGVQKDSILLMDKGIAINKTDKFRNQRVLLNIYVPVGKRIKVDRSISWYNNVHIGKDDDWYYSSDDNSSDWKTGVEYIMNADGRLYNFSGTPAGKEGRTKVTINSNGIEVITDDRNTDDNYHNGEPMNKIDSMKVKLENEKQKIMDSLQKAKDKIEAQLKKLNLN